MVDKKDKLIYVTQPFLPPLEEFIPYLEKIWDRKWLTNNGEFHQKFEKELAEYLGVKYISLFANGTLALITALQEMRITGEVITTPFSFVATTHSLWWNNIKPVFVDIEADYFNIDPEKIEAAITPKTTAIMPVHVYGNPCNVEQIQTIADKYGLKILYDACHTFNTRINNIPVLNYGNLSVMSFHATKVFTTFEGGAIVTHDEKTKKRIDYLKNFGFAGETTVVAPGINAKMNEFQAALGLLQLKYVDQSITKRKDITEYYRKNLENIDGIFCMKELKEVTSSYSYFPVLIDRIKYGLRRDELYEKLRDNGINSRRYFYPLISNFPTYNSMPSADKINLPVANKISEEVLCLPLYPELQHGIAEKIVTIIVNGNK